MNWDTLSPSAAESDDSFKHAVFKDELLQARQKWAQQTIIPFRKFARVHRPTELVNIDGKEQLWGNFERDFYAMVNKAEKKGKFLGRANFIIKKDVKGKEKGLHWERD